MKMKVLVCGARDYKNYKKIETFLKDLPKDTIIIHGGCEGADNMAGEIAYKLNFKVLVFKAEWNKYGKAAGPIRNQKMIEQKPDLVIAFHDCIEKSKGTKDMISKAEKYNIQFLII